ncbi:MAG: YaiI/YqxD family protein [Acinetobacter sp.]|jgi:uncharacterized protein YaiI (UPF0178 family)|nr:MAG: YaiI/YqxD family protein [Acinetobacter sp.]
MSNELKFQLWVDADALPNVLREIILRASDRFLLSVTFVANQHLNIPRSTRISTLQVAQGADVADQMIVDKMSAQDIVVTQDIPLAAQVIAKGGIAIHPRGEIFTESNVKARLHLRDFMDTLRGAGVQTGGPAPMNERDKREFANALEQTIRQQLRKTQH